MKQSLVKSKIVYPLFAAVLLALFLTASFPVFQPETAKAQIRKTETSNKTPVQKQDETVKMPDDLLAIVSSTTRKEIRQDVIVQFDEKLSSASAQLIKQAGGAVKEKLEGINSLLASVPVVNLNKLAANKQVVFITPDRKMKATLDSTNILIGTDKLRKSAPSVYGGTYAAVNGSGIGVAVIDSGIDALNRDDFRTADGSKSRIVYFKDWADNGNTKPTNYYDDYGHGTPVAGVIGGNGWASQQKDSSGVEMYPGNYGDFTGIAPAANIIALRVIDGNGSGAISNAISAIDYAVTNKAKFNIRVINLSLGAPVLQSYKTDPLCLAVKRAFDAGIVVVVAAGNNGHNDTVIGYDLNNKPIYQTVYGSISSPANSPYVITVGAAKDPNETILKWHYKSTNGNPISDVVANPAPLRRSDVEVAGFSSRGPTLVDGLAKPDVVAPGYKIVAPNTRSTANLPFNLIPGSVVPNTATGGVPKAYVQLSGTSFAAPVVSGIAALMLQANPSLTPRQVKALIMLTAQRVNDTGKRNPHDVIKSLLSQGAGLVNGFAAVRLAQNARIDANKAVAGDSVLKTGRTLEGLNEDLKLNLTNSTGLFTEKAVFNSGILMADGMLMSDGILMADGMLMSDGILMADGMLMSDGILMADGMLMSDGILMADGSLFPDGILMADSYVKSSSFTTSGTQKYVTESAFENAITVPNKSFNQSGVKKADGNVYGKSVFSPQGYQTWGNSVMNPTSILNNVGTESADLLASEDDAPIAGITNISNTSKYYPAPR